VKTSNKAKNVLVSIHPVGRINSHVQGTRPNAVSAFPQSISSARTQLNTITFTYYATSIPRYDLRVVLRVTGEPTHPKS
jgi:hypothetical protein